jgi:hypothetical protein
MNHTGTGVAYICSFLYPFFPFFFCLAHSFILLYPSVVLNFFTVPQFDSPSTVMQNLDSANVQTKMDKR